MRGALKLHPHVRVASEMFTRDHFHYDAAMAIINKFALDTCSYLLLLIRCRTMLRCHFSKKNLFEQRRTRLFEARQLSLYDSMGDERWVR